MHKGSHPLNVLYSHMYWMTTPLLQNFHRWDTEYRAQTHQATEITWLIRLFINMTRRGQIQQAPPYPPGLVREIGRGGREKRAQGGLRSILGLEEMFFLLWVHASASYLYCSSYCMLLIQSKLQRKMHPIALRTWK